MRMRVLVVSSLVVTVMTAAAAAQQAKPEPAPGPTRMVEPPAPNADQPNIQFDIAVTDEGTGFTAVKKNVVVMVQAGGAGSLRSRGVGERSGGARVPVNFNVDVKMPPYNVREPNKIRARVTVEYQPFAAEWKMLPSSVSAQVDASLESGKKMILWQTADPVTNLRTTIEVTATVLK
jgi:hypothetical protein